MRKIKRDLTFKICVFGEKNVGKSSLIKAATRKEFNKLTRPPVIIDIETKELIIDSIKIVLQIWVLRFDFQFEFLFPIFLSGTLGGIFLYDITKFSSLSNIEKWITIFRTYLFNDQNNIPLAMVGGKCDLFYKRTVPKEFAEELSQKYKFVKYFECSSKTGKNVDILFEFLTKSIMKIEGYF
ncbi:MAG: Rab family GTPase [Candidatus Thorarchaeota archaeon]